MSTMKAENILSSVLFAALVTVYIPAKAEGSDSRAGEVSRGATSWSQNCNRCHEMRDPTEFRDDQWRSIVMHMRVRAGLNGQQQRDILAFLQASNNPKPIKLSAGTPSSQLAGSTLSGKMIYDQTCVACHGPVGSGVLPGVPDFTASKGPLTKSDKTLIQHITEGFQSPGSPMAMPAKGGNPDLSEADVHAVLEYIREDLGQ